MNRKTLKALRELMKKQADLNPYEKRFDLYNVLGAIRGPDIVGQYDFKVITVAIRAYVGMEYSNCSGAFGILRPNREMVKRLKLMLDRLPKIKKQQNDHYIQHLKYAVKSIGRQNLMDFAKRRWGDPDL